MMHVPIRVREGVLSMEELVLLALKDKSEIAIVDLASVVEPSLGFRASYVQMRDLVESLTWRRMVGVKRNAHGQFAVSLCLPEVAPS
jgi:hypothetical protein